MRGLYNDGFPCIMMSKCPFPARGSHICEKASAEYRFERCGKYYEFSENALIEGAKQFNGRHKAKNIIPSPEPV